MSKFKDPVFSATDPMKQVIQAARHPGKAAAQVFKDTGRLPDGMKIYHMGKVYVGRGPYTHAVCISERFSVDDMAAKDPNRLSKPKGWK